jgi:glucose/arabinose dehydrogenase
MKDSNSLLRETLAVGVVAMVLSTGTAAYGQSASMTWSNNCASCHGEDAAGGEKAKTLLTAEKRNQDLDRPFYEMVRNGSKDLPSHVFKELKDVECWSVIVHLRELQEQGRRKERDAIKRERGTFPSMYHTAQVEDVISKGLEVPWSVDFLPDGGGMLVTEKVGRLRIWKDGALSEPLKGSPEVRNRGQGGLMDVAVHPDYLQNGWIYLAYSDPFRDGGRNLGMTKIVRGKIKDGAWVDQQVIFEAKKEHYLATDLHFGCRIVFSAPVASGADKGKRYVFWGIGERGMGPHAQDRTRPNGKIHRLWDDGSVPADNPFVTEEKAYPSIYTYGNRNPQGLAMAEDGTLFETEHGPRGGDEVNIITKGANYGWPDASYSINYSDMPLVMPWPAKDSGVTMPVYRWLPSTAACGLDIVRGNEFPKWKGDLLAGGLAGNTVRRVRVEQGRFVEEEEVVFGLGRVRDVVVGPEGMVYIVLNNPDKVVRMRAK